MAYSGSGAGGGAHARETLYLSFGALANHMAAHFWNAQDAYLASAGADSDPHSHAGGSASTSAHTSAAGGAPAVLDWYDASSSFRAAWSAAERREVAAPRALVFDARGALGHARGLARLYRDDSEEEGALGADGEEQGAGAAEGGAEGWGLGSEVQSAAAGAALGAGARVQRLRTGHARVPPSAYQRRRAAQERGEEVGEDDEDGAEEDEDGEGSSADEGGAASATAAPSAAAGARARAGRSGKRRAARHRSRYAYWSDYLRVDYHPRSLLPLDAAAMAADDGDDDSEDSAAEGDAAAAAGNARAGAGSTTEEDARLAAFDAGYALARETEREKEVMDERVRWFAEDCDLLSHLSLTTSLSDGFAGFAQRMLEELQDEYPKVPTTLFAAHWGRSAFRNSSSTSSGGAEMSASATATAATATALHPPDSLSPAARRRYHARSMNTAVALALGSEALARSSAGLLVPLYPPTAGGSAVRRKSNDTAAGAGAGSGPAANALPPLYRPLDMYHASALLSAHVESATLPSRMQRSASGAESAGDTAARLLWRGNTPLAALAGVAPTPLLAPVREAQKQLDPIEALLAARGYAPRDARSARTLSPEEAAAQAAARLRAHWLDLSHASRATPSDAQIVVPFAESLVARDHDANARQPTLAALEHLHRASGSSSAALLEEPFTHSAFVPGAYPTPDSFPRFFTGLTRDGRPLPSSSSASAPATGSRTDSLPLVSALRTTPETYFPLAQAKRVVQSALSGHAPLAAYGIDEADGPTGGRDGLKEIRERLEDLLTAYHEGLPPGVLADEDPHAGKDTDEEWEESADEWDLGEGG